MLVNHAPNDIKNKSDINELLKLIDISELLRHIAKYILLCKLDGWGYMREYEIFLYTFLFNICCPFLFFSCKAEEIMRKD